MTETNRTVAVLKQLVPEFLKPLLRPFYRAARFGYGKLTHHPDSRDALHDYWRNPPDAGNFPTDYLHGGGRSPYLVELVGRHIGPAGRRERILEVGCNGAQPRGAARCRVHRPHRHRDQRRRAAPSAGALSRDRADRRSAQQPRRGGNQDLPRRRVRSHLHHGGARAHPPRQRVGLRRDGASDREHPHHDRGRAGVLAPPLPPQLRQGVHPIRSHADRVARVHRHRGAGRGFFARVFRAPARRC